MNYPNMEYNQYNQNNQYNQPVQPVNNNIICPQITVWFIFVMQCLSLLTGNSNTGTLFSMVIQLILAILITNGIRHRYYHYYKTGLIISMVESIMGTIYYFISILNLKEIDELNSEEKTIVYAFAIILSGIIWIETCILCSYRSRVERMSNCNNNYNYNINYNNMNGNNMNNNNYTNMNNNNMNDNNMNNNNYINNGNINNMNDFSTPENKNEV